MENNNKEAAYDGKQTTWHENILTCSEHIFDIINQRQEFKVIVQRNNIHFFCITDEASSKYAVFPD